MTGKICIILGTRPEVIKMSPVVRACEGSGAEWFMAHTGQGCSRDVCHGFLGGLGLPDAKDNPDVVSGAWGADREDACPNRENQGLRDV